MPVWKAMRVNMVECQIRPNGVTSPRVLAALLKVQRENFLSTTLRSVAYMDEELPLQPELGSDSRVMLSPQIFARLLQLAQIAETDLVLDVGCGLGYSSAVLACLAGSVVGLEADDTLAKKATERLAQADIDTVAVVTGPLEAGHPAQAPYDVIVVEHGVPQVPETLIAQLAPGGRLVAIVGDVPVARAWVFAKSDHGQDADQTIASRAVFDVATSKRASVAPVEFVF